MIQRETLKVRVMEKVTKVGTKGLKVRGGIKVDTKVKVVVGIKVDKVGGKQKVDGMGGGNLKAKGMEMERVVVAKLERIGLMMKVIKMGARSHGICITVYP